MERTIAFQHTLIQAVESIFVGLAVSLLIPPAIRELSSRGMIPEGPAAKE